MQFKERAIKKIIFAVNRANYFDQEINKRIKGKESKKKCRTKKNNK